MQSEKLDTEVNVLAKDLESKVNEIYGTDMGFFLMVIPFEGQNNGECITNIDRISLPDLLEKAVNTYKGDTIGETLGNA